MIWRCRLDWLGTRCSAKRTAWCSEGRLFVMGSDPISAAGMGVSRGYRSFRPSGRRIGRGGADAERTQ